MDDKNNQNIRVSLPERVISIRVAAALMVSWAAAGALFGGVVAKDLAERGYFGHVCTRDRTQAPVRLHLTPEP